MSTARRGADKRGREATGDELISLLVEGEIGEDTVPAVSVDRGAKSALTTSEAAIQKGVEIRSVI